jgi:acetyl-CoA C-acetyltransferase
MTYEAVRKALDDAGLSVAKDIDNTVTCSHDIWDGQTISNIGVTDVVGGHLRDEEKTAMDGSTAAYYAAIGILSGEFNCTLVVAHTKMSQTDRNIVNNTAFDPIYSRLLGLDFTSAAALQARRYLWKRGFSEQQVAHVTVKNLANAMRNPVAHNKGRYTPADVLNSPVVAAPIRLMDIAPDSDGAVALIMASEDRAKAITDKPVWVMGLGTCYDAHYLGDRDLADCWALERAAGMAYRMAGLRDPAAEIDVIELGDEFSYQELLWLEGLGICGPGEAARLNEAGFTSLHGKLPVNPSGGLLGGVPTNVAGLNSVAEAARQLRGEAGEYQVAGARIAVAQGHSGACGQHQCVLVLGRD